MQVHETQSDIRSGGGGGGVHGERERARSGERWKAQAPLPSAEQNRTEMGNRQKVRGWLHTSLERASENNNLLGVFTVGVAYGQRSEAIRNESAAKNALRPSKRARML